MLRPVSSASSWLSAIAIRAAAAVAAVPAHQPVLPQRPREVVRVARQPRGVDRRGADVDGLGDAALASRAGRRSPASAGRPAGPGRSRARARGRAARTRRADSKRSVKVSAHARYQSASRCSASSRLVELGEGGDRGVVARARPPRRARRRPAPCSAARPPTPVDAAVARPQRRLGPRALVSKSSP